MGDRGQRKERIGIVISDKMSKSIVVRLTQTTKHPTYKRIIKKSKNIMAHDEKNEAKVGDKVKIEETRPLSKNKRWRLVEVLK
jgi:small subunit ribosomal protein S17